VNKKFIITGAAGLMGVYLSYLLVREGHDVYGIDIKQVGNNGLIPNVNYNPIIQCNLRDTERLSSILNEVKPDCVYHLAACIRHVDSENEYFESNVLGTMSLFKAIKNAKIQPHMLVVGSSSEYGNVGNRVIDELCDLNPVTVHGVSKVSQFHLCRVFSNTQNLPFKYLRVFNHTAPSQSPSMVCSRYAREVALIENRQKGPMITVRKTNNIRDFVDTRDVVSALYWADLSNIDGEVYNICSGKGLSILEIVNCLVSLSEVPIEIVCEEDKCSDSQDILSQIGSFAKAKRDFNWQPKIPLNETLRDILNYWRRKLKLNQKKPS